MSLRVRAALAALVLAATILGSPASGSARTLVASPGVGIDYAKLPGLQEGPAPWKASTGRSRRSSHMHLDVYIRGMW